MEPTAISLPWLEVAKLALGTGVVATIVTQGFAWAIERWKSNKLSKQEGTYLAARIAVTLEQFAIRCAEQIADNEMFRTSSGHAGRSHGTLPSINNFPPGANWATLDPRLLARSLSIPNELMLANRMISFWADIDPDPPTVWNACDAQAGKCGYRAWRLADDLRRRYRLPDFVPKDFSWDSIKALKDRHDREVARIKEEQREVSSP